jgi:predicted DNA-binding protein (UPF0251 family)
MSGYGWHWRHRHGPGRPFKPRIIKEEPKISRFIPVLTEGKMDQGQMDPVIISYDELEAIRLVDYQGLMQEEAAQQMGISRGTLWRCLERARKKISKSIVEGRELIICESNSV